MSIIEIEAVKNSIGKTISNVVLDKENDRAILTFEDKSRLVLWDDGQDCCERRYMVCDADLPYFPGAKLLDVCIRSAENIKVEEDEWYGGEHEVQFLIVKTDKGDIDFVNHNEHNGYYGGFNLQAKLEIEQMRKGE
jgi:hypothetical protein